MKRMKEELYQWVRNMAVFYILFTAILNLVPDKKYEKYVRFFMGLLLIFMMSTPIFSLFGKGQELTGNFQVYLSRENKAKEEKELENLQKAYLEKGYETELGKKIQETLQKKGIEIQGVKVNIEGEQIQVVVITGENVTQEQKGRIADELVEEWGLEEGEYHIQTAQYVTGTVDHSASAGTSTGSGGHACVRSDTPGSDTEKFVL